MWKGWVLAAALFAAIVLLFLAKAAHAHDVYTDVHGKDGQWCCNGDGPNPDCARSEWRLVPSSTNYEFLSKEGHWITIPQDRITFLPLPGDIESGDAHRGHLCYSSPGPGYQDPKRLMSGEGQTILFYCAFISPGGV